MTQTKTIQQELRTTKDDETECNNNNNNGRGKSSSIPLMEQQFPLKIAWRNVIFFIYLHSAAVYGLFLLISGQIMWETVVWGLFLTVTTGMSITAGCHRLWAHKSYKAKLPLQVALVIFQTIGFQNSVYEWCRDHRLHHKYSETNADPHNVNRGFFFAHIGWLLCKKHPAIREKGKGIDMSDLENDPLLDFQRRHYVPLMFLCCFVMPTMVPMYLWNETFTNAFFFATQLRFCFSLNATWLVNSAAHLWGAKPYNKAINPSENKFVSIFAMGEGWHNYHHTFPWDYKTAELGNYQHNWTTAFIDFMAKIGLAYDLKTVDKKAIMRRKEKTGDGSHAHCGGGPWGWGDKSIPKRDINVTRIINGDKGRG